MGKADKSEPREAEAGEEQRGLFLLSVTQAGAEVCLSL